MLTAHFKGEVQKEGRKCLIDESFFDDWCASLKFPHGLSSLLHLTDDVFYISGDDPKTQFSADCLNRVQRPRGKSQVTVITQA